VCVVEADKVLIVILIVIDTTGRAGPARPTFRIDCDQDYDDDQDFVGFDEARDKA
jgi:hypothetical protein